MRRPLSSSILSMVPSISAKGPSAILTASPTEKLDLNLGAFCWLNWRMLLTSVREMGVGLRPMPTKEVTPGVERTVTQASSVIIILTRMYPGNSFSRTVFFLPLTILIFS